MIEAVKKYFFNYVKFRTRKPQFFEKPNWDTIH